MRGDLETYKTIMPAGLIINRTEEIGGLLHVLHSKVLVDLVYAFPLSGQGADGLVVVVGLSDRLLKDRRIGG
jgi:hypothetical protein